MVTNRKEAVMKDLIRRALIAAACCVAIGGLAACGNSSLAGKTLYSVSAWDGSDSGDSGEVTTITFDDTDGYHYTPAKSGREDTGTWKDEDGNIVLTSATFGGVTTLVHGDDGSYGISGENSSISTRYFFSQDDAQAYADEFIASAPERVVQALESSDFTESNSQWTSATTKETISFANGEAVFTKGAYSTTNEMGGTYLFKQGPSEDDWTGNDHSGSYEVTVEKMTCDGFSNNIAAYTGTLTVGDDATEYKLTIDDEGNMELALEQLTFSTNK